MACSKLFSGDSPELSIQIIQNLHNNLSTLYSLALVNRFWCRLAIPILWEDPFSIKFRDNLSLRFLDTYLLFLNENDKNEVKTILPYEFDSNLQNPLFNYPSLIKTLNFPRIFLHVSNWISYSTTTSTSVQQSYFPLTLIDYCDFQADVDIEKTKVIYFALFNLFIEHNASLNNLCIKVDNSFRYQIFNDIFDMILKNPKFFSKIFYFRFYDHYSCNLTQSNNYKLLKAFLSSISSPIKHIDFCSSNVEVLRHFANIIQSQSQLSSIKFGYYPNFFLDSLKYHSNTLTSINFSSCNFSQSTSFDALSYLTQLESLQFKYCYGWNSKVIQPLLNITTSLKIKTLVFIENSFAPLTAEVSTSIQLLVQKIGSYIENLILDIREDELRRILFNEIIDSCEKITFLHLSYIRVMDIPLLSKMIQNFGNYLKYLTLEVNYPVESYRYMSYDANLKISSMILKELTKLLPPSLHYLNLSLVIDPDHLRIAFKNCNQVELKRLLIRDKGKKNNEGATLKVIKDFVKEKNIEFLSYSIGKSLFNGQEIHHQNLEKLVEETQSFIKMMRYDDLVVKVSDIDGNLVHGPFERNMICNLHGMPI